MAPDTRIPQIQKWNGREIVLETEEGEPDFVIKRPDIVAPDSAEIAGKEMRLPTSEEALHVIRVERSAVEFIEIEMNRRQIVAQRNPEHARNVDEGMPSPPVCAALWEEELVKGVEKTENSPSKLLHSSTPGMSRPKHPKFLAEVAILLHPRQIMQAPDRVDRLMSDRRMYAIAINKAAEVVSNSKHAVNACPHVLFWETGYELGGAHQSI